MTSTNSLGHRGALCALGLLTILSGCDGGGNDLENRDQGMNVVDNGPDIVPIECTPTGEATRFRVTTLHIPTPTEAGNGAVVGHNVDRTGDTCGVPDYAGGVDNSLIDLAAALPALPSHSQAPTLCSDPSQPGCHVDHPDAPRHPSSWDLHHEPVDLSTHNLDIPPQAVDTFDPAAQFHGGPRAGQARTPWRPPSA